MVFKIISGNFKRKAFVSFDRSSKKYRLLELKGFSINDLKIEENISAVSLITEDNQGSFVSKAGWGLAGGLLFGPVGLLAGVLSGGNQKEMCCAIEVYPEYKFIAVLDPQAYTELSHIAKKNAKEGKILPNSDLIEEEPEPAAEAESAPKKDGVSIGDLPRLKQLLDDGIITEEEFAAVKKKALGLWCGVPCRIYS